jgi:hypothetical protein
MNGGAGEARTPDLRFRNLIDILINESIQKLRSFASRLTARPGRLRVEEILLVRSSTGDVVAHTYYLKIPLTP